MPFHVSGLGDLLGRADAFLIDQFGTIHDGEASYPGAIDTLRAMRAAGKKVILLSNSGRRATNNVQRLEAMGIGSDCFDASLCSGEVAWQVLRADPPAPLRRRCRIMLFARDPALDILEGFEIEAVDDADDADLVMIAGSETDRHGYEGLWSRMAPAAARGVPAICTNPDRLMLAGGRLHAGAGALAEAYHMAGGRVHWFGKPHPDVYKAAFALLPTIARHRIMGVGDSLEHDIAGAAAMGCPGLLIRTGIIADLDEMALEAELLRHAAQPSAIAARFTL